MLLFIVYLALSSVGWKAEEQGLVGSTGLSPLIHLGISLAMTVPLLALEKSSEEGILPKWRPFYGSGRLLKQYQNTPTREWQPVATDEKGRGFGTTGPSSLLSFGSASHQLLRFWGSYLAHPSLRFPICQMES